MEEDASPKASSMKSKMAGKAKGGVKPTKKLLDKVKKALSSASTVGKLGGDKKKSKPEGSGEVGAQDRKKQRMSKEPEEKESTTGDLSSEIAKERKKLEESKRLKAKDVKQVGEDKASPKGSFEASDNESNARSGDPKVTAHLEALPMTPTNWCADVEYDREVVSLLSLYERAPQLGYLSTLTHKFWGGRSCCWILHQRQEGESGDTAHCGV